MSLVTDLQKKYKVTANQIADQLHKYPDEIWDLLSRWYYHQSFEIEYENIDADEIEPGVMSDMKQKYKTDDAEKALSKCSKEHTAKADKIAEEIHQKYKEVADDLFDVVLGSNLQDKFDKWMHSKQVYNPVGDPLVKYLDH